MRGRLCSFSDPALITSNREHAAPPLRLIVLDIPSEDWHPIFHTELFSSTAPPMRYTVPDTFTCSTTTTSPNLSDLVPANYITYPKVSLHPIQVAAGRHEILKLARKLFTVQTTNNFSSANDDNEAAALPRD